MSIDTTLTISRRQQIKSIYAKHDHDAHIARFGFCSVCRAYNRWNEQMKYNMLSGGGRGSGKVRKARKS